MRLVLALFVAFLSLSQALAGGVLAIDYGTEWMKVSLVKAGVPFDVLLNTDSKRKIQSVVALRGEDRWIGGDAANLASRFPDSSFPSTKLLLGHSSSDVQAEQYQTIYRAKVHTNTTTSKATLYDSAQSQTQQQDVTLRSPEELLALQFNHAKKLAKDAAGGENIKDTVVTVPVFFTQAERQSILDALEIAGLTPLALIDDGSAIAINYAMTRTFPSEEAEHHLFYDAGAGSIRATIVSFKSSEVKDNPSTKTGKNVTLAEVVGVGWDKSVGGLLMDAKIRDMLEEQFSAKEGKNLGTPVKENKRAQAKLMKEASRVKQVLSANAEAPSRIEGLAEDVDFRGTVSREAFEAACQAFKPSFASPITAALKSAGLSIDDINSVILVGGSSRVPMIQAAVKAVVGEDKIAQNLNADEAAVMGAALFGAAKSSQFRTKDIRVTGLIPYDIEHAYDIVEGTDSKVSGVIFNADSPADTKQVLTFKKTKDFTLDFAYRASSPAAKPIQTISTVEITGITSAFANLSEADASDSTVQVTVEINESNMLHVISAQLILPSQKDQASVADKIKGFFSSNKDKDQNTTADDIAAQAEEALKALKKATGPLDLEIITKPVGYQHLAEHDKREASKRLRELDQSEARKRNREEARNGLEAYLYRLRDTLESPSFIEASTDGERIKIRKQLEEANEWLWDAGETAPTKDLRSAKSDLERSAAGPTMRLKEAAGRIKAISDLATGMMQAQTFLTVAKKQLDVDIAAGEPSKYTEVELTTLKASVESNEKWLGEVQKSQSALKMHEDPVLRIADLERRTRELSTQVAVLKAKRPPRKPKKTTTTAPSSSETASAATSSNTQSASTASEAEQAQPSETSATHSRDEL